MKLDYEVITLRTNHRFTIARAGRFARLCTSCVFTNRNVFHFRRHNTGFGVGQLGNGFIRSAKWFVVNMGKRGHR